MFKKTTLIFNETQKDDVVLNEILNNDADYNDI